MTDEKTILDPPVSPKTTPPLPVASQVTISVIEFGPSRAPPPASPVIIPLSHNLPLHDESFKQSLPEGSVNIVLPEPRTSKPPLLHHKVFGVLRSILPIVRPHNLYTAHKGSHDEQGKTSVQLSNSSPAGTAGGRGSTAHRAGPKSGCSNYCRNQSRSSVFASKKATRKCCFSKRCKPKGQPADTEDERDNFGPAESSKKTAPTNGVRLVDKPSGRITRKLFCVDAETGASILDTWLWKYVMGDAPGFSAFTTAQKGRIWWYPLVFLDYCRGAGRLVRVNNPWSGVIFIMAMGLQDVYQLIFGALGAASASATAWCLNTPTIRYKNGAIYFNGFLLGLFIWNNGNYNPQEAAAWWCIVPVLFFGVMSAFVKNALDGVCNMYRVPVSSSPYGLLVLCYLGSQLSTPHPAFPGNGVPIPTGLDVPLGYRAETIVHGIFFSISQVFYCGNFTSVVLCWCAVLLNSPLHCFMLMSGAAIGTYIATLLGVLPLQLYTGMWSFNSMLTMSYLGGHFWVLNGWAFPFSCVAGALLPILLTKKFTRF
ncbi:hypothetical protein RvY_07604-2 [Ramazzottius varieornatus]|uniref:Uncharacterized protein n=1 Tax=Ramazzottius varieornatus TaxID=947166 RepID=A0A1D1V5U3_RAMVA|nr:hypothetical protein RvY_07604-2 [Ramazzottius varieornatus]